jgi:hypothetical protein
MFKTLSVFVILFSASTAAVADTVDIAPSLDNSIYSEDDNSNALGDLFAGVTNDSATRRALMMFDIAGNIPAGATINSVTLDLTQTKIGPAGASTFELHALSDAWGAGTSDGTGTGGSPTTGDATWNYNFYNTSSWATPGGDFAAAASGTASIGTSLGDYTFASQSGMVADVQDWLDSPSTNYGWLLEAANESTGPSAREFGSRFSASPPELTVTFTPVPEPGALALFAVAVAVGGLACLRSRRILNRPVLACGANSDICSAQCCGLQVHSPVFTRGRCRPFRSAPQ